MSSTFVTQKRAIQYTTIAEVPDRINKGSNRLCTAMVAMQNARGSSKTVPFELKSASWRVFIRQVGVSLWNQSGMDSALFTWLSVNRNMRRRDGGSHRQVGSESSGGD